MVCAVRLTVLLWLIPSLSNIAHHMQAYHCFSLYLFCCVVLFLGGVGKTLWNFSLYNSTFVYHKTFQHNCSVRLMSLLHKNLHESKTKFPLTIKHVLPIQHEFFNFKSTATRSWLFWHQRSIFTFRHGHEFTRQQGMVPFLRICIFYSNGMVMNRWIIRPDVKKRVMVMNIVQKHT